MQASGCDKRTIYASRPDTIKRIQTGRTVSDFMHGPGTAAIRYAACGTLAQISNPAMPRIDLPRRYGRVKIAIKALLALSMFIAGMNSAYTAEKPSLRRTATPDSTKPDAEVMLIDIYRELSANRLQKASEKADDLVAAYPNFRLGHLLRGDLLLIHTRPVDRSVRRCRERAAGATERLA